MLTAVLSGRADEDTVGNAEQLVRATILDDATLDEVEAALLTLVYADRPDRAALWAGKLLEEATARRAPTWQARLASLRAEIALRQGDLPTAQRLAQSAMTYISPRSWGVAVGAPIAVLVLASTATGADEIAGAQLRRPVPEAMFHTRFGLQYLCARGHHNLASDRVHAALEDFSLCGERAGAWGLDLPALVPWRSGAAAAYLRLGRPEQARLLAKEELARSSPDGFRSRGVSLRLLAEATGAPRRRALLAESVRMLRLSGDRVELARSLASLGLAHHVLGEPSRARRVLAQAVQLAERCGARPLHRSLPAGIGKEVPYAEPAGHAGDQQLSTAERRVASLAALGHSNREIADRLCISVSTVEQHLTRVYRKLNVTGRADLPIKLHPVARTA
jgi:DNA-binding CsgD family transcriptional regulator